MSRLLSFLSMKLFLCVFSLFFATSIYAESIINKATETASKQNDDGGRDEENKKEQDNKEEEDDTKEGFVSKIQTWHPAEFSGPCQIDLDRHLKIKSERANLESTKQLNGHTNDGFKIPQKQLY